MILPLLFFILLTVIFTIMIVGYPLLRLLFLVVLQDRNCLNHIFLYEISQFSDNHRHQGLFNQYLSLVGS